MSDPKRLIVLTGAGISAESGIPTFREIGGIWQQYDLAQMASPEGWETNPKLVLEFYNQRRRQLLEVQPNKAHLALVELEQRYEVYIITQNIDDLHERAGSQEVIHLHGELLKARSTSDPSLIYQATGDILVGDECEMGSQLRPHVVWFGEEVPMLSTAAAIITKADLLIVIGSSMQIYPAAGLVQYAPEAAPVYYIDPNPSVNIELGLRNQLEVIPERATIAVPNLVRKLMR